MSTALAALRDRLAAGGPVFGTWSTLGGPLPAEILAQLGFDYVCVDLQHGLATLESAPPAIQGIAAAGSVPLVRVPGNEPWLIMRALDLGASGVVVPLVSTPDEAQRAARACRYPPAGNRSWGPVRTAPGLGATAEERNEHVLCIAMIETVEGVASLEAICGTPGIDAVYVGSERPRPRPRAGAGGGAGRGDRPDRPDRPGNAACRQGSTRRSGAAARAAIETGYAFATVSSDRDLLARSARAELAAALGKEPESRPATDADLLRASASYDADARGRRARGSRRRIFVAAGTPARTAEIVAASLVLSNLKGVDSHGVMRVPEYLGHIESGRIVADAEPLVERNGVSCASPAAGASDSSLPGGRPRGGAAGRRQASRWRPSHKFTTSAGSASTSSLRPARERRARLLQHRAARGAGGALRRTPAMLATNPLAFAVPAGPVHRSWPTSRHRPQPRDGCVSPSGTARGGRGLAHRRRGPCDAGSRRPLRRRCAPARGWPPRLRAGAVRRDARRRAGRSGRRARALPGQRTRPGRAPSRPPRRDRRFPPGSMRWPRRSSRPSRRTASTACGCPGSPRQRPRPFGGSRASPSRTASGKGSSEAAERLGVP